MAKALQSLLSFRPVIAHSRCLQHPYHIVLLRRVCVSAEPQVHARLTSCSHCRGDLLHALTLLDEEDDINKVLKYFSYEHFYVIYCKVSATLHPAQKLPYNQQCTTTNAHDEVTVSNAEQSVVITGLHHRRRWHMVGQTLEHINASAYLYAHSALLACAEAPACALKTAPAAVLDRSQPTAQACQQTRPGFASCT